VTGLLRQRMRPRKGWVTAQDPVLIDMLVISRGANSRDGGDPLRDLWDEVRDFVIRDRLGLSPDQMARLFPADWDGLYHCGLSPETAARLVVWDAALADLLSEYGATKDQFRFDFERAFCDGYSPWQAIQEALGLSAYGPGDLPAAPVAS
jgi:hypothetical protein